MGSRLRAAESGAARQHEDAIVSSEQSAPREWGPIVKTPGAVAANLQDYPTQSRSFSWDRLRAELFERADDRMNIASLAIDRPAALAPDKLAVRFIDAQYAARDLTYDALLRDANRFANLLEHYDVKRGEVVATLLGRCPELFVTVLGTLKAGCVFSPWPIKNGGVEERALPYCSGVGSLLVFSMRYLASASPNVPPKGPCLSRY